MTDWDIMLTAKPYTMTSGTNLLATIAAVKNSGSGDFVECGVSIGLNAATDLLVI
jgi:hypothetical protein